MVVEIGGKIIEFTATDLVKTIQHLYYLLTFFAHSTTKTCADFPGMEIG